MPKTYELSSNVYGSANYYPWYDGYARTEYGYFVSLVDDTFAIKVCEGANIFGVTIDRAAFVGNMPEGGLNNTYALVATTGCVSVRCESNVKVGDSVISNKYGVAEKTDSECGYTVSALSEKFGVNYAVIALGVQACITDAMGQKIQLLEDRVGDAEINIAAAMNVANEAYKQSSEGITSNQEISNRVNEALNTVDGVVTDVESLGAQVSDTAVIAAQARAISESAATSAESMRNEAVTVANSALDKAGEIEKTVAPIAEWEYADPATGEINKGATYFVEYMENGLATKAEMETVEKLDEENKLLIAKNAENFQQMLSSVDKYSIGEYSQAYGLTLQQARNILTDGMVYIPTPHDKMDTHRERYIDGEGSLDREFTHGFYYVWTLLNDGTYMWSESIGKVWFGTEQPAGTAYDYWYDGTKLYILNGGQWRQVATLAGNVNNRIVSMIRQEVDEVALEVANARGSAASLEARLTDTESEVQTLTAWTIDPEGNQYNLATIKQTADEAGADIALVVQEKDGEKVVNGASIAAAINSQTGDSFVSIEAKYVNLKGQVTFESFDKETQEKIEADTIDVQIWSSRGNIFKSRNIATILTCHVFSAGVEITDTLPDSAFTWEKINDDGTVDTEWRATPYGNNTNAIQITDADVYSRAVFNCAVEI